MAVLVVACALVISWDTWLSPPVSTRPVTEELLRGAPASREGWLVHGRDWSNQRYSPLAEINRGTVRDLTKLWDHRVLLRSRVTNESTPIVVDDLLIYTDARNHVVAVSARTGRDGGATSPFWAPPHSVAIW